VLTKQIKVALTDRQLKALKKESATLGISLSELLRRILDTWVQEKQ
jgi:predicted DNA binding CopG/RHH family protein